MAQLPTPCPDVVDAAREAVQRVRGLDRPGLPGMAERLASLVYATAEAVNLEPLCADAATVFYIRMTVANLTHLLGGIEEIRAARELVE